MLVSNVTAAKPATGGALSVAPLATTLPTTANGALDNAFKNMGYISEDGLTHDMSRSTQSIKAWGGDIVLDIQDEKTDDYNFTLIEALNADVLKLVHGDTNVTGALATGISITANAKELPSQEFVFDMIMRDGALKRIVIPNGRIINVSEVTYSDSDAVGYACQLRAYPDASENTHYEYILKA